MAYSDPGAVTAGNPLPAAYLNTTRANGAWFSEPPQCSVYNSAVQSIPNSTVTAMLCPSESLDNTGMHISSVVIPPPANTSRITAVAAGRYTFTGTAQFAIDGTGTGMRRLTFRLNGTTEYDLVQVAAVSTLSTVILSGSRTFTLAVNDYAEMVVHQNSGGALNVQALAFEAILVSTTPV